MLTATAMMLSMNARSAVVVVAALSFLISACSKSAPAPGKVVTIDKLCDEADESRVRVSGYLRYRRGLLSFCSTMGGQQTCDLALYAAPEAPPKSCFVNVEWVSAG